MKIMLAVFAVAFAAMFAPQAHAAGMFGEEDSFNTLQKITIPAELATELGLPAEWVGDKTELDSHSSTLFVFAGVNITDKGYAIRVTGTEGYWPLEADLIAVLQERGVLPNPMPSHAIPIIDLLFGYSLWIVIAGVALFYGAKALLFPKKKADVEAVTPEPPAAA
ncbi:MAG: hypothetical protein ABMA14_24610 [Hyphomonadaceae bacterium]